MKKNIVNKNIILYKVTQITTNQIYCIIISLKLGWILWPLKTKNNYILNTTITGHLRIYKFHFKIKGFGFQWFYFWHFNKQKSTFYFKLGLTHRIALLIYKNTKCKTKKKRLILWHRSYFFLRQFFNLLFFSYKTFLYNKKGLFLRGTRWKLKLSKKKAKF